MKVTNFCAGRIATFYCGSFLREISIVVAFSNIKINAVPFIRYKNHLNYYFDHRNIIRYLLRSYRAVIHLRIQIILVFQPCVPMPDGIVAQACECLTRKPKGSIPVLASLRYRQHRFGILACVIT